MEEQESNRPYHLEDDDSMLEERDGLEMTSSSEIIDSRGIKVSVVITDSANKNTTTSNNLFHLEPKHLVNH